MQSDYLHHIEYIRVLLAVLQWCVDFVALIHDPRRECRFGLGHLQHDEVNSFAGLNDDKVKGISVTQNMIC